MSLENAALLAELVRTSASGLAVLRGEQLVFELVNDRYQAVAPTKRMLGRTFAEVWPEVASVLLPPLRRVLDEGVRFEERDRAVELARAPGATPEQAWFTWTARRLEIPGDGPRVVIEVVETTAAVRARARARAAGRRTRDFARATEAARALAEAMPQMVWMTDALGDVEYVNHRWVEYTGRSREALLGAAWAEVVHPEDRPRTLQAWRAAVGRIATYDLEYRLLGHDGAYRWHLARGEPFRDATGAVVAWVGTTTDIDDEKRAELERARLGEAVASQREMLLAVLHADPGAVAVLVGPELRYAFANDAYREILPVPGDPVGRSHPEVWGIEADAPDARALRAVVGGSTPVTMERRELVYADGRRRVFSVHVHPLMWEGERAVVVVAWETTALDAARAEAERAASDAAARAAELSAVLDSIADGLVLYDQAGLVLRTNAVARRLGMREGEPIADRFARMAPTDAAGEPIGPADAPFRRALRGETVRGFAMRLTPCGRRDGAIWVAVSAAPVRRPDGTLEGAVATFSDVTELRRLEDEREDLVRMISHDLRTPLTVILTQAQLLARTPDRLGDVPRRAQAIRDSGDRMRRMLEELVDAARLEAGQTPVALQAVNVARVVEDLLRRLEGTVEVGRVHVRGGAIPLALADAAALERIVVNLLTNALKYSPPGAPVDVELASRGEHVSVTVRDRGVGIPEDEQPRVFERFYRSRSAVRKEGIGLGLYITRLIAERMGGSISLESAPGCGSAFTVTLPAAQQDDASAASGTAAV